MGRMRLLLVAVLIALIAAAVGVDQGVFWDDDGDEVLTIGQDCGSEEEILLGVQSDIAEANSQLIVLDEQWVADPTNQEVIVERTEKELELATLTADQAVAERALATCQNRLSEACMQAHDDLVALTEEQAEAMETRTTLLEEIEELTAQIRNPDPEADTDVITLRGERSAKQAEFARVDARVKAINEELPELERQAAICGATGVTPEELPDDRGHGVPGSDTLWGETCGDVNEEATAGWYAKSPNKLGSDYFGPPSEVLGFVDPTSKEALDDLHERMCWDTKLVSSSTYNAAVRGRLDQFKGWADASMADVNNLTVDLANDPELWATAINAIFFVVEDGNIARLVEKEGQPNKSMFATIGPDGIPLVHIAPVGSPTYTALEIVDEYGNVLMSWKLDCGFQPEWPKDIPPVTPTTTPSSTIPPPSTSTPPSTVPPTTPPTSTPPTTNPPTTQPPERPKCVNEDGELVEGADPDGDGYCGTPDSGPEQQGGQDNDPEDVAPTPNAPVVAPPPPPAEPPTPEEIEAVGGNTPPPELADDPPAPASDGDPGVVADQPPSSGTSGGGGPDPCPSTPQVTEAAGTPCPPPPPPPPPPSS